MNQKDLSSWMQENKYDAIIHLAAIVPIDFVNKHKKLTYNVNVKGTENLIKFCFNQMYGYYISAQLIFMDIPIN